MAETDVTADLGDKDRDDFVADLDCDEDHDEEDSTPYVADRTLEIAAEVAYDLGQPLLLTGEPGTGKTRFARHVAKVLAPKWLKQKEALPLHVFSTKSVSAATDLFYRFDHMRRFHAAHDPKQKDSIEDRGFINYEALGRAILETKPHDKVAHLLPAGARFNGPRQSVVLIDEIDKAPRDFPNDILMEIERMWFQVPEVLNKDNHISEIRAAKGMRPIVVLTSNSEKNLPSAFLRRCVFHHINFPKREQLEEIVEANLVNVSKTLIKEAIDVFYKLRALPNLDKRPATAELVRWIETLQRQAAASAAGAHLGERSPEQLSGSLGALMKSGDDLALAKTVLSEYARVEFGD